MWHESESRCIIHSLVQNAPPNFHMRLAELFEIKNEKFEQNYAWISFNASEKFFLKVFKLKTYDTFLS